MPALVPSDHYGIVTWLGLMRVAVGRDLLIHGEEAGDAMPLTYAGYEGEVHAGLTRPSCSRVQAMHPRDTEIRNTRQVSVVSEEEMAELDSRLRDSPTNTGLKTPQQGAATQVWAATSPQLHGLGGVYCEDCDIAEPAAPDTVLGSGVKAWATDPQRAARLWQLSAELTDIDAFG